MDTDEVLFRTRILAFDTLALKSFSCLEFNDEDACAELMPTNSDSEEEPAASDGAFILGDYAWPVGIYKKDVVTGAPLPCQSRSCHWDGSPAFDLSNKVNDKTPGTPVYAITDGTMNLVKEKRAQCWTFHIAGKDGYDYFYGHVNKPIIKSGSKKVNKGDLVAEIGSVSCGDTISHLHIDQSKELYHQPADRTENLNKIINDLYEKLPDEAPVATDDPDANKQGWQWPIKKSDFNGNITNCWRKPGHTGIDLGVSTGTTVYAAKDGEIVQAGDGGDAGNYVMIKHGGGRWTNYQHLSSIIKRKGTVSAGEPIGKSGNTGYSLGPHLHFSITDAATLSSRTSGQNTLNPLDYLPKDGPGRVSCN
ncbi:MAG: M23 family metallopeptidase [Candidatus Saccharimonadales bacterium]